MKLKTLFETNKNQKRPQEFYQDAWDYFQSADDKFKTDRALNAFKKAGKKHNVTLSGCMTNRSSALSYMQDDVKQKIT